MNYVSTRDNSYTVTAAQAIFQGLSHEGGLFVPESIPSISAQTLSELAEKSYIERAEYVLSLFLTDFTPEEIKECVTNAYSNKFDDDQPAPLSSLVGDKYFLELWHGPTCAFKDMALQLLPELLKVSMRKVGGAKKAAILVATSGDTGKAALEGFKDVEDIKIMVFYPENGVSPMQKRQMYTQDGNNVSVVAIDGNFDDAQTGVKKIFSNKDYEEELAENGYVLSSANSINWGRLLPQIVYYVSTYCDLLNSEEISVGDKINFCVPTGNFGNILAAHYAREMGVPINKLVCASNDNNVLTQAINQGVYDRNRDFFATNSPSMDILISSNFERLVYQLVGNNSQKTNDLMVQLNAMGQYNLDSDVLEKLKQGFWADFCTEKQVLNTIKTVFDKYSYLCDTHTAVAVNVAEKYIEATGDKLPMVVVSTASPYKFVASVLDALEADHNGLDDFGKVDLLEKISTMPIPTSLSELKTAPRRFDINCAAEDMIDEVKKFLS